MKHDCICGQQFKSKNRFLRHQQECPSCLEKPDSMVEPTILTSLDTTTFVESELPSLDSTIIVETIPTPEPVPIVEEIPVCTFVEENPVVEEKPVECSSLNFQRTLQPKPKMMAISEPAMPKFKIKVGTTTGSWWQYYRWIWNIARNMRITNPDGAELTAVRTFIKLIWNPMTQTGTRNWLQDSFVRKAGSSGYAGDIDNEQPSVVVELLEVVGRNFNKVPITITEQTYADTLIIATGNRRYGTSPYFGGVSGSTVSVP